MNLDDRVLSETEKITDVPCRDSLRTFLITPRKEDRNHGWLDGDFICWVVAELLDDMVIVYCENAFADKWGVLKSDNDSLEGDGNWFQRLEDAFRSSSSWTGENPIGYEIP